MMPGGIYLVAMPRTDLPVMARNWRCLETGFRSRIMGLVSTDGAGREVMGDLVLTETEIAPS